MLLFIAGYVRDCSSSLLTLILTSLTSNRSFEIIVALRMIFFYLHLDLPTFLQVLPADKKRVTNSGYQLT